MGLVTILTSSHRAEPERHRGAPLAAAEDGEGALAASGAGLEESSVRAAQSQFPLDSL